jgi:broad specificity phosphatase PhoE
MLKPDDTIQFFTSPYRRTRETTEGILKTLTSDDPDPSPFPRHTIKVYEEPRLREQDFGNFQPCSAEMERMWQERADYGHFFYRIPNGESAADAYDRISGFNESLWRQFGDEDFPSVCVLVTHGLMTRVFLMKWFALLNLLVNTPFQLTKMYRYHWSVEYFEDLRNVNHCEFIIMKQSPNNGKFILENQLRTWSELKRRTAAINTNVSAGPPAPLSAQSPATPMRRWGGCVNGCNHDKINYPRRPRRQNTADFLGQSNAPPQIPQAEKEDAPPISTAVPPSAQAPSTNASNAKPKHLQLHSTEVDSPPATGSTDAADADVDASGESTDDPASPRENGPRAQHLQVRHLHPGRDFGGSRSGAATPSEGFFSDDSDYFPDPRHLKTQPNGNGASPLSQPQQQQNSQSHSHANHNPPRSIASVFAPESGAAPGASSVGITSGSRPRTSSWGSHRTRSVERRNSRKDSTKNTKMEAEWAAESGMGSGARADALGDGDEGSGVEYATNGNKGKMEKVEEGSGGEGVSNVRTKDEEEIENEKMRDRASLSEVY